MSDYSEGHLSRVEHGEATPSRECIEAYEDHFHTDSLLRSLYEMVLDAQRLARLAQRGLASQPEPYPLATRPGDRSHFLEDLSTPDGTIVPPKAVVIKRWRVRNAGTVPWDGRMLERIGAASGPGLISSPHRVPIPHTAPGQAVDLEVEVRTPELPGTAIAYWQMVDAGGHPCFPDRYADCIYCVLVVRDDAPPPPTPRRG